MSTGVGGRAICVSLLEKADQIHEDEEEASCSDNLFEDGGLEPLYQSLHSSDETISPHQITLLKLLDGYIDVQPRACESSPSLSAFLPNTLLTLLRTTKSWTSLDRHGARISNAIQHTYGEQTVWENAIDKENAGRPILGTLRAHLVLCGANYRRAAPVGSITSSYSIWKAKPIVTEANAPPTDKASLPASRFELQKRDLVRLLGILVHDDPSIQPAYEKRGRATRSWTMCDRRK
ncbi:extracellular matrix protein 14 [Rhizoctonia solani]|uniref:Extracellular matrix protein 14 n=1 Tax=Rhizoctonia solani TaxID=456999 RepID=A0A8H8STZ1_9AGAM|nr:extracellular matrix protein 14 [Rhizoctonia solani]QRW16827.1 extracellular matrix protein 14 [Rhizoctonia solani]